MMTDRRKRNFSKSWTIHQRIYEEVFCVYLTQSVSSRCPVCPWSDGSSRWQTHGLAFGAVHFSHERSLRYASHKISKKSAAVSSSGCLCFFFLFIGNTPQHIGTGDDLFSRSVRVLKSIFFNQEGSSAHSGGVDSTGVTPDGRDGDPPPPPPPPPPPGEG